MLPRRVQLSFSSAKVVMRRSSLQVWQRAEVLQQQQWGGKLSCACCLASLTGAFWAAHWYNNILCHMPTAYLPICILLAAGPFLKLAVVIMLADLSTALH